MDYFPYHFSDQIILHGVGKSRVITYKVLFLPAHFEEILPFTQYPRLRVEGEIADVPVRGAWTLAMGDAISLSRRRLRRTQAAILVMMLKCGFALMIRISWMCLRLSHQRSATTRRRKHNGAP